MAHEPHPFVVTAPKYAEGLLQSELAAFSVEAKVAPGALQATGSLIDAYRVVMGSRLASRVLWVLGEVPAHDAEALYDGVRAVPWEKHVRVTGTIAVDFAGTNVALRHTRFGALKVKDAIVDRMRDKKGARPNVDTGRPDVPVHVHLRGDKAQVAIDLGGPLHERGYRGHAEAPLRENLAAAVLTLAGWPSAAREGRALLDPMCGSGTLLVEAALMARDVAPGLLRSTAIRDRWLGHDADAWRTVVEEARARRASGEGRPLQLFGSDRSKGAVAAALRAFERVGFAGLAKIQVAALRDAHRPVDAPGLVVTNPPYGERLGDEAELVPVYELLGDVLKRHFAGWDAWVLTGSKALAKRIGLRPSSRTPLMNGPIECRLLHFPLRQGAITAGPNDAAGESAPGRPGWRKPSKDAAMFENRLTKNAKRLASRFAREGVDAYRVYDRDIPEYAVTVDRYGDAVRIEEYAPPPSVPERIVEQRRVDVLHAVSAVLGVPNDRISMRLRRRRMGDEQHEKRGETALFHPVHEGDLTFLVNLDDYLDTGLFLDDRNVRKKVRALASGRTFLNLFAYTCAASVAAVRGGATAARSVDLSRTYLGWGERNFRANDLDPAAHTFIADDVWGFLAHDRARYGLVLLAPPTHSRSKRMERDFDVARDHGELLDLAMARVEEEGVLLFTTNLRSFELDPRVSAAFTVREITHETVPQDFERSAPHRAFLVTHRGAHVHPDEQNR